jgi:hypothetical protein
VDKWKSNQQMQARKEIVAAWFFRLEQLPMAELVQFKFPVGMQRAILVAVSVSQLANRRQTGERSRYHLASGELQAEMWNSNRQPQVLALPGMSPFQPEVALRQQETFFWRQVHPLLALLEASK